MTPIGRGQRQLIIGDRQTGKTAIAIDTIINQTGELGVRRPEASRCAASTSPSARRAPRSPQVRQALEEAGAMEYTTIVAAPASDPAGFKYIAPYTGSAIGQHWMYQGKHVLIVFDDLTKQAEAYRAISLLLRRPPGREAYPGDVFYLHSRLLERCAKLSDELGGGSLTGLPIIETKGNDVSAYIPTNVISITDGQIFLETDLFNSGVRPAINVGISVSRVGGNAQIKAMKKVAGGLKLGLSQYRDLEAFAAFASDLDAASRAQLERGARLVELLKQGQYSPYSMEREVVSVWAGTTGQLDDVPVEDIGRFESEYLDYIARERTGILDTIRETGELSEDTVTALKDSIDDFRRGFETSDGHLLVSDEPVKPVAASRGHPGDRGQARARRDGKEVVRWEHSFARSGGGSPRCGPPPRSHRPRSSSRRPGSSRHSSGRTRPGRTRGRSRPRSRQWSAGRPTSDHPLTTPARNPTRAAVLILTSDRGFCGGYNASVLREAQGLTNLLAERGIEALPLVSGRKGIVWHRFRERPMMGEWSGFSDTPSFVNANEITRVLIDDVPQADRRTAAWTRSTSSTPSSSPC